MFTWTHLDTMEASVFKARLPERFFVAFYAYITTSRGYDVDFIQPDSACRLDCSTLNWSKLPCEIPIIFNDFEGSQSTGQFCVCTEVCRAVISMGEVAQPNSGGKGADSARKPLEKTQTFATGFKETMLPMFLKSSTLIFTLQGTLVAPNSTLPKSRS